MEEENDHQNLPQGDQQALKNNRNNQLMVRNQPPPRQRPEFGVWNNYVVDHNAIGTMGAIVLPHLPPKLKEMDDNEKAMAITITSGSFMTNTLEKATEKLDWVAKTNRLWRNRDTETLRSTFSGFRTNAQAFDQDTWRQGQANNGQNYNREGHYNRDNNQNGYNDQNRGQDK
ncbi:hypothetical protein MTR67_040100 [Solanum verrucosum]|uniref:Integrase core domain containing protein n=1 Tax=Solanum verrucosum TaxID=315347 RepID=A0AAF0ZRD0_SOLVR|nr:hypothetical protein MTR67_040100 [Solanum verrucosum]